jgi:putative intracellular protease/amidase
MVTPDIALRDADASDYSAIVFVGGWGSSMYQYAFEGNYANDLYDGDAATKTVVNDLINDFVDQDKYVAAICHGVTVLAWARVDGASPLEGKNVSVPWIGSPAVEFGGQWYGNFQLMQYPQVVANGATANTTSGQYGDPTTAADDVVVDGRIITAENYDSALAFGTTIAEQVIAAVPADEPADPAPTSDPPAVPQPPVILSGQQLLVFGTAASDLIYLWSRDANQHCVWMNGQALGTFTLPAGGRIVVDAGAGDDQVDATDTQASVWIKGGSGNERISGGFGNDLLLGGDGNDVLVGGAGRDLLIGGRGSDYLDGGAGEDLLIGGTTAFDDNEAALLEVLAAWSESGVPVTRTFTVRNAGAISGVRLTFNEAINLDTEPDCLLGGADADWLFLLANDCRQYSCEDMVTSR